MHPSAAKWIRSVLTCSWALVLFVLLSGEHALRGKLDVMSTKAIPLVAKAQGENSQELRFLRRVADDGREIAMRTMVCSWILTALFIGNLVVRLGMPRATDDNRDAERE